MIRISIALENDDGDFCETTTQTKDDPTADHLGFELATILERISNSLSGCPFYALAKAVEWLENECVDEDAWRDFYDAAKKFMKRTDEKRGEMASAVA